ncbi:MAG: glycosyltransferase family 39 protein [Desulfosalsimonadaceae bacterium]
MPEHSAKRLENTKALIGVVLLSAAVKIILLLFYVPFNSDGVLYITAAQKFAAGHFAEGLAVYPMPLYPLMITVSHFIVPDWEIAAKLVSLTCQVLALVPLYFLTARLLSRRAAFWACLAFALAPLPNDWAVDVIRGPAFVLFVLLAVYSAQKAVDAKKPTLFFLTAFLCCASFLLRIEGVILLFFFSLYLIYLILIKKGERAAPAKGLAAWMLFLVIFSALCLLALHISGAGFNRADYIAEKARHIARLGFLDNYHMIYEQLEEMEKLSPHKYRRENLAEVARHYMYLLYMLGEAQIFIKVLFPPFLVALILGLRRSPHVNPRRSFVLSLLCFYLLLMYILYVDRDYLQRRFLFAPVALAFPWVGLGLERIFARLAGSLRPRLYLAVFLIIFFLIPVSKAVQSAAEKDNVLRRAGDWVEANAMEPDARYFSNDPLLPFFAGLQKNNYIEIQGDKKYNFTAIEEFALKRNVDILLLKVPKELSDSLSSFSRYREIKHFSGEGGRSVYIYCKPSFCSHQKEYHEN